MMGHSRHVRLVTGVVAAVALVAMAVVVIQGHQRPLPAAISAESSEIACGGDCANCPSGESKGDSEALDNRHPGTVTVDPEKCVGCVRCVNVAPDAFQMNAETGMAEVIEGATSEDIALGIEACPVAGAIR